MKLSICMPVLLSMVSIGLSTMASAAPRDAGSKIRGDYAFESPSRASQRMMYRAPAPSITQRSEPAVAQAEANRRFSAEPSAPAANAPPRKPTTAAQAPAARRFSYEPQVSTGGTYRRPSASTRSRGFSPVRSADSKIRGDY